MKNKDLNPREKEIMELLWKNPEALTSTDMLEKLDSEKWNKLSVFRTINGLINKEFIVVNGFEQYNTQYARKFTYAMTKEEYLAKRMKEDGMGIKSLSSIALAFMGNEFPKSKKERKELINDLQHIIDKLKEE
ncbi:BlaI/MecI/CopY family transcriptional regulator [Butyrivibrio sp. VCD2006]|uniref:BlaI/MecI/CopY family transcriptional regulator n=1 Tax=Butyrivibrio sp. VCD2006 TaxID=1280664 RepID=UPI00040FC07E|nr:BlaI/MecI/CopY family transcriptional regulator [Butyrivibrio sp. VCD2006]